MLGMTSGGIFYNPYHKYNAVEAGLYAGLHRPAWAFGTVGLLMTASHGHTTVVQKVLSWSPFIPISKLVYGAYLMHLTFQFRSLAMTVAPQYMSYFSVVSGIYSSVHTTP